MRPSQISLVWIGHVDHGKSSTLGHLLYLIGAVDQRTIDKYREEAEKFQRSSWVWAYVLDSLPEEMEKGITADIAFFPFKTEEKRFMLIDAPGHRDFVKNMIRGTAQADACVLVVSAVPNDLKAGLKHGRLNDPGGQTREHTVLASVLGVQNLIVAINKMDLVDYKQENYNTAVQEVKELITEIKSPWLKDIDQIPFVPISGFNGENLIEKSSKMNWYSGPTLIDALNNLKNPISSNIKEMRYIGYDSDEKPGIGTFLLGKTLGQDLVVNTEVKLLPSNEVGKIKEIWTEESQVESLVAGEHGEVLIKGIDKEKIDIGAVLIPKNSNYVIPKSIIANILIMEGVLVPGTTIITHCGASYSSSKIHKITKILSANNKYNHLQRQHKDKINLAFEGELIGLQITLDDPLVVERFKDFQDLGRIILRKSGQTIGVGIVTDIIS